jgi:hypothetical protein
VTSTASTPLSSPRGGELPCESDDRGTAPSCCTLGPIDPVGSMARTQAGSPIVGTSGTQEAAALACDPGTDTAGIVTVSRGAPGEGVDPGPAAWDPPTFLNLLTIKSPPPSILLSPSLTAPSAVACTPGRSLKRGREEA